MASATAPALVALGLAACLAAPAAAEPVYIWRDAGGAVRFGSLQESEPAACVREEPVTPADPAAPPPIVVADALP